MTSPSQSPSAAVLDADRSAPPAAPGPATYFTPERNRLFAAKLFDHIRNGTTDMFDEVFEYDIKIYSDPGVAARERERIFGRLPVMAAHSDQVRNPGDFFTLRMNNSNVLLTRKKDGTVGAFLNVCRHRGAKVVGEDCGSRFTFSCPYHGWNYANDGSLRAISYHETVGLTPSPERGLVPLPVEERHGFVWVVENPEGAIDVERHLGPGMDQLLAEYRMDTYSCYRSHVFELTQNWKVMMDGLNDAYHSEFVHGATIAPYIHNNILAFQHLGRHSVQCNARKAIDKLLDEEPGATPLDRYVVFGSIITPNTMIAMHPHHAEFWTVYQDPKNTGRCFAHLRYLTRKREHDERAIEVLEKNWRIANAAILNEDVPVGDGIQSSADATGAGRLVLGRNEIANQVFHRAYDVYMNG